MINFVQIVNEMCIVTAYCLCGVFYFQVIFSEDLHGWLVLGCLYASYMLHCGVILYNIVTFIARKINERIQVASAKRFERDFFRRNRDRPGVEREDVTDL